MNMADERLRSASVTSVNVVWDPLAEAFIKLTIDCTGRILARADLDAPEKSAVIRRLMARRTTQDQRRAIGRLLSRFGLREPASDIAGSRSGRARTASLNRRFAAVARHSEIEAFVQRVDIEVRDLLVAAWSVVLVSSAQGEPLPGLEEIDADFPYFPPVAPLNSTMSISEIDAILEEASIDADGYEMRLAF